MLDKQQSYDKIWLVAYLLSWNAGFSTDLVIERSRFKNASRVCFHLLLDLLEAIDKSQPHYG